MLTTNKKKLTLRISESAIKQAKQFAQQNNLSVSQLVEGFLATLTPESNELPASPVLERIAGILADPVSIEDYYRYLEEKHS